MPPKGSAHFFCLFVSVAVSEGAGVFPRTTETWEMDGSYNGEELLTQNLPLREGLPDLTRASQNHSLSFYKYYF